MIDFNINSGAPVINNEVDLIIQQIDMLFDTNKREVHGNADYGCTYDEFLFNLNVSNSAIEYAVECDLKDLQLFGYQPSVQAIILEGTLNDIILLKIGLSKGNFYYEKTYKFQ